MHTAKFSPLIKNRVGVRNASRFGPGDWSCAGGGGGGGDGMGAHHKVLSSQTRNAHLKGYHTSYIADLVRMTCT